MHKKRNKLISSGCCRLLILVSSLLLLALPATTFGAGFTGFQDWLSDNYRTDFNGFVEVRGGLRFKDDPQQKNASIAETRLQLDLSSDLDWAIIKIKGDFVGDQVEEEGRAELRELNVMASPLANLDLKIGRQVLTWGTGDLLFINDLFPKDWESFFIGRDDEYLKAPSDAVKASLFFDIFDLDLVYVPIFNQSKYIDGSRMSYWNGMLGRIAGRDYIFDDDEKNSINDSEFAARFFRNLDGLELALYTYYGYWKTPEGLLPDGSKLFNPELSVVGVSARGTMLGGVANVEAGYYDSREDSDGTNPLIRNSEIRFLVGLEREIGLDLTADVQYYLEYMQDYDAYAQSLPIGAKKADEFRHLFTLRLTKLLMSQNLRLSIFVYYSPSDQDSYWRPKANYKITDQWSVDGGGNLFFGSEDHTFFGQFSDANNVYIGLRRDF